MIYCDVNTSHHSAFREAAPSAMQDPHLVVELLLPGASRWWLQLLQDSPVWMLQYT